MHQLRRHIQFGLLIIFACSLDLRAAERVSVRVAPDSKSQPSARPATEQTTFDAALSDLGHGSFDPLATELENAEEQWTRSIFNVPSLSRARAITYRNAGGDNLLTE